MTTDRLYYGDSNLVEFDAIVTEASIDGLRLYLDRTAFYPASGGQPIDHGFINEAPIADVIDQGQRILHVLSSPVNTTNVHCRIDQTRRIDHMQQHTGQHLLSAVFAELHGIQTVSFHMGAESSTIDLNIPSLDAATITAIERRANQAVMENRSVAVSYQDAAATTDLRKASEREGTLRIVTIDGLDRSACGGTHVRSTAEIGPIQIRKIDKIRGIVRLEFLCGLRTLARIRADFEALSQIARSFSAPLDDTPALTAALIERSKDAEKASAKLTAELAQYKGRELYQQTEPTAEGLRRHYRELEKGPAPDDLRALAQSFAANPKAVFVLVTIDPPAALLAASTDSGIHAGNVIKAAVTALGGRGGGNPQMAQGSIPNTADLPQLKSLLGQ